MSKSQKGGGLAAYIERLKAAGTETPSPQGFGFNVQDFEAFKAKKEAEKKNAPGFGFGPGSVLSRMQANQQPDTVPVMAKPGEYFLPPDTVAAVGGPQALDALVSQTHTPSDAGAIVPRGFRPQQFFADGGLVEEDDRNKVQPATSAGRGFTPGGIQTSRDSRGQLNVSNEGATRSAAPVAQPSPTPAQTGTAQGFMPNSTRTSRDGNGQLVVTDDGPAGDRGFHGQSYKARQQDAQPGFGFSAESAKPSAPTSAPGFGFGPGSVLSGMQQDPLASDKRANAIRQEMIDSQRGGVHILGGGGGMDADRQALLRKTMTAHPGAQNGQLTAAQLNAARGIMSDAQGEMLRGKEIAQHGIDAQNRNALAAQSNLAQTSLGRERLQLDTRKFQTEQSLMQRQQAAQSALDEAMASGDPSAINRARMRARSAGVQLPEREKLQAVKTDSGFMTFNPLTGEMRPAVDTSGQAVGGGSGKPLNEGQSKAVGYGTRAAESSRIIDDVGQGGKVQPSLLKRAAESVPLVGEGLGMVANQFASPEQQQVEQAQRDYVNAVLRQESGAAISQSEFDNARRQYFPQPGDSPEVVEQKRRNRETAIDGFRVAAGPGAKHITPRQQQEQAPQQPAAPGASAPASALDFLQKNPQHAAAFKAKYGYLPEGY